MLKVEAPAMAMAIASVGVVSAGRSTQVTNASVSDDRNSDTNISIIFLSQTTTAHHPLTKYKFPNLEYC
jgi:hypothetical protein